MDKQEVIRAVFDWLRAEFEAFTTISKQTRSSGNDDESKAEGKYDTRSTEDNYLADGQAKQAYHAAEAIAAWEAITIRDFAKDDPIDTGALVEVRFDNGDQDWLLIGPAAGGVDVKVGRRQFTVVTPESPLGGQLCGLRVGDSTRQPKAEILRVM